MSTRSAVWAWHGDLDSADVPVLAAALQDLLLDHPATLTIDLDAVTFLDCGVLSLLVRVNNDPSTTLILRGAPVCVQRLLQATGLTTAFQMTAA